MNVCVCVCVRVRVRVLVVIESSISWKTSFIKLRRITIHFSRVIRHLLDDKEFLPLWYRRGYAGEHLLVILETYTPLAKLPFRRGNPCWASRGWMISSQKLTSQRKMNILCYSYLSLSRYIQSQQTNGTACITSSGFVFHFLKTTLFWKKHEASRPCIAFGKLRTNRYIKRTYEFYRKI